MMDIVRPDRTTCTLVSVWYAAFPQHHLDEQLGRLGHGLTRSLS
jgi:hypothetical protein